MTYTPTQPPGNLDADGLRRWLVEELQRIARSVADDFGVTASAATVAALQAALTTAQGNITTLTTGLATANAAIAKLTNNQFARVYLNAAQTGLAASTYVKINFDTTEFDIASIWDNTNKQFKPTIAGYYRFSWQTLLQVASGSLTYLADLHKNGVRHSRGASAVVTGNTAALVAGSATTHMNGTTDVVDIRAFITGTASRDVVAGNDSTWFAVDLVKAD